MLNILPSINMDTDEVTLNVRPTISRQIDTVNNPTIQIIAAQVEMEGGVIPGGAINADVPVLEIRELDSVMKLKSGSVMVIGGLMEDNGRTEQEGLPFLSSVPWVGNAFKNSTKTSSKTELIIFIKATIVGSNGGYHQTDKNVYEKFTDDPRPLSF
jgi:general secretion pathway protein D